MKTLGWKFWTWPSQWRAAQAQIRALKAECLLLHEWAYAERSVQLFETLNGARPACQDRDANQRDGEEGVRRFKRMAELKKDVGE